MSAFPHAHIHSLKQKVFESSSIHPCMHGMWNLSLYIFYAPKNIGIFCSKGLCIHGLTTPNASSIETHV